MFLLVLCLLLLHWKRCPLTLYLVALFELKLVFIEHPPFTQIDSLSSAGAWREKTFSLSLLRLDIDFTPALPHNATIPPAGSLPASKTKCGVIPSHRKSSADTQLKLNSCWTLRVYSSVYRVGKKQFCRAGLQPPFSTASVCCLCD